MTTEPEAWFDPDEAGNFPPQLNPNNGDTKKDYDPHLAPEENNDNGYFYSVEQLQEIDHLNDIHPTPKDWKHDKMEHLENITVTIDKVRRQTFKQAKIEVDIARKTWGTHSPTIDSLFKEVFGENGRLFHVMQEELQLTHDTFCKFMATFYFSSQLCVHVATVFESPWISTDLLLPLDQFTTILKKIAYHDTGTTR